jgi:AcrR family transcriptional regulator
MRLAYHNGMSIPYESSGRTSQKARTREAIVGAARRLIESGVTPTIEQAAAEAAISRTTVYRYFPSQRLLLAAAYPYIERRSLLVDTQTTDPEQRLRQVIERHTKQTLEIEPQLRATLRLSLEATPAERDRLLLRRGRAIGWIEDALAPLQGKMSEEQVRRLAMAIRTAEGIEALVWLTDIAGLSREDAVDVMRWSAHALLRFALVDGPPPVGRDRRSEGAQVPRRDPAAEREGSSDRGRLAEELPRRR